MACLTAVGSMTASNMNNNVKKADCTAQSPKDSYAEIKFDTLRINVGKFPERSCSQRYVHLHQHRYGSTDYPSGVSKLRMHRAQLLEGTCQARRDWKD